VIHRRVEKEIGGKRLAIETGRVARQAGGAAWVTYGDTVVLVTATQGPPRPGTDFFPLTVEYEEKMYAAGKFPGGFFKREGRPTTKEILTMRLIDRPIRPLFPKGFRNEVQVVAVVLSADLENDPDVVAMVGSSAALTLSEIPFDGPIASVRVGRIEGKFVINPTHSERELSDLDLIVAGTSDAVVMVEGGANELPEEVLTEAIYFGHSAVKEIIGMISELAAGCGKEKIAFEPEEPDEALVAKIREIAAERIRQLIFTPGKQNRADALEAYYEEVVKKFATGEESAPCESEIRSILTEIEREALRRAVIEESRRVDGRSLEELRPMRMEVGILPRTHGSALFTRGETQAVVVVTLGTASDVQRVDGLFEEEIAKKFMLHYNFPPFSVGEVKPIRGPGRREIGHGVLAERSLEPVLPPQEKFPYTIRIVSDITESNGSSSMASVCGGTLCMMDAGIPIRNPVAGVAMGLIKEGDKVAILTDILGVEDHFGDMDFKVAGTQHGITTLQLDIKMKGLERQILERALQQAKKARIEILKMMLHTLERPRREISRYAPRLLQMKIPPDKIGLVIGTGGKMVRLLQDETGAEIEIEDDGTITISAAKGEAVEAAKEKIEALTAEVEVGKIYTGRVTGLKDFGAFIEILPGTEGLCHISEFSDQYVDDIRNVVSVGDQIRVKVLSIDDQNRIRLSRKAALKEEGVAETLGGKIRGKSAPGRRHFRGK